MTILRNTLLAGLAVCSAIMASDAADTTKRLDAANTTLTEMMDASDKGVPQDLWDKAVCIIIVPGLKKAGFVFGAKYGKGFVVCRKPSGTGWTGPAAVRIEGGSFGLQIGVSETDLLMIVQNDNGKKKLLQSKFTIGGSAEAAAGPVGRTLTAETDAQLRAEMLSYSRSRGAFAGVSLQGATLRPDDDDNMAMYGKAITNKEILANDVTPPPAAATLEKTLSKYSVRKSS